MLPPCHSSNFSEMAQAVVASFKYAVWDLVAKHVFRTSSGRSWIYCKFKCFKLSFTQIYSQQGVQMTFMKENRLAVLYFYLSSVSQ